LNKLIHPFINVYLNDNTKELTSNVWLNGWLVTLQFGK